MIPVIDTIMLDECGSTNSYLASIAADSDDGTVVAARAQTAGRGQRGNSWESQPGCNLTFSVLIKRRSLPVREQFHVSEAVALGVADTLGVLLPGTAVTVKWPNDIYVGDRKICGILIENSLSGDFIGHSVAGIGINVNQERFMGDAPNPVSLTMLTGRRYDLDDLLGKVCRAIFARLDLPVEQLHSDYMAALWRRDGGAYRDTATGEEFHAIITDVASTGHLSLLDTFGAIRTYAFKEVAALI